MPKRTNSLFPLRLLPSLLVGFTIGTALADGFRTPQLLAQVKVSQPSQIILAQARIKGENLREFGGKVKAVAVSPDGQTLLVATADNKVNALNLPSKKVFYSQNYKVNDFSSIALSSDGQVFAIASEANVLVFHLGNGKLLHTLKGHTGEINDLAISPDGNFLVSVSGNDRTIRVWDLSESGELLKTIKDPGGPTNNVVYQPNGTKFVTGSIEQDRRLRFWNAISMKLEKTSPQQPGFINDIAITPDNTRLVAAVRNFLISWNLANYQELMSLKGPSLEINMIAVSPDNRTVATADKEGTIMLFDLVTRRRLITLTGHRGWVLSLTFSPDGKYLYSGAEDKLVKRWQIKP